jgi:copper chaperone CopZ
MELPGVTGVSVELATQGPSEVRIESEVDLDAATVAAAITEAGYQMVSSGE